MSVVAALLLFKRRLTDTCVLGNLPKTGTGFVGIHDSLREIPEGDEKYSRYPACVKTLRISKGWENIPQNRIKTGARWETYPFLCGFLLCRWENFSCAALFLEFLHCLYRSLFFYHSRMTKLGLPIFLPFENDGYYSSFSSVSVRCRRASSFKRRLTDTCVLGNLPNTGTGFGKVHASLREIPEGDEKSAGSGFSRSPKGLYQG